MPGYLRQPRGLNTFLDLAQNSSYTSNLEMRNLFVSRYKKYTRMTNTIYVYSYTANAVIVLTVMVCIYKPKFRNISYAYIILYIYIDMS